MLITTTRRRFIETSVLTGIGAAISGNVVNAGNCLPVPDLSSEEIQVKSYEEFVHIMFSGMKKENYLFESYCDFICDECCLSPILFTKENPNPFQLSIFNPPSDAFCLEHNGAQFRKKIIDFPDIVNSPLAFGFDEPQLLFVLMGEDKMVCSKRIHFRYVDMFNPLGYYPNMAYQLYVSLMGSTFYKDRNKYA